MASVVSDLVPVLSNAIQALDNPQTLDELAKLSSEQLAEFGLCLARAVQASAAKKMEDDYEASQRDMYRSLRREELVGMMETADAISKERSWMKEEIERRDEMDIAGSLLALRVRQYRWWSKKDLNDAVSIVENMKRGDGTAFDKLLEAFVDGRMGMEIHVFDLCSPSQPYCFGAHLRLLDIFKSAVSVAEGEEIQMSFDRRIASIAERVKFLTRFENIYDVTESIKHCVHFIRQHDRKKGKLEQQMISSLGLLADMIHQRANSIQQQGLVFEDHIRNTLKNLDSANADLKKLLHLCQS